MKKIAIGKEAREKLADGAELMYKVVGSTLGPVARNVAISRRYNIPIVIADGVSIARDVQHNSDEFVNMGIDLIRQAAEKTVVEVGDGTTTSVVLSRNMIKHGMKLIDKGENPMQLRRQMRAGLDKLIPEIKKHSTPVNTNEQVKHIATISSADEELGELVAEAIDKVGRDGQISTEEAGGDKSYLEIVQGMTLDAGYASPYFVTSPKDMEAVVENPRVCIFARKVTLTQEIAPFLVLMAALSENKSMVFVGDIGGDALKAILDNKLNGNVNALVVNPPGAGDRRRAFMDDIATLTGTKVIDSEIGLPLEELRGVLQQSSFGMAQTVVASKKSTTIIPKTLDNLSKSDDKARIEQITRAVTTKADSLRGQIKKETSIYDREILQERLAKLTTGVAVVRVGARTEIDMREKIERVKDAVGAAKSSLDEGIVPGSGVTFLKIRKVLDKNVPGEALLWESLQSVTYKLLKNAGIVNIDELIEKLSNSPKNHGYNALSAKIENMIDAGIVDPARLIRLTLENAVAVSGSILTTDSLIADEYVKPGFKDER